MIDESIACYRAEKNLLEKSIKTEYSEDANALSLLLSEARIEYSMDIEEGGTVDLDEKGYIMG